MRSAVRSVVVAIALAFAPVVCAAQAQAPQVPAPAPTQPPASRPTPPTRDPRTAGFVDARELPDGTLPPVNTTGNFIIGPTHEPAAEATAREGVPRGRVCEITMTSGESRMYPGIARDPDTFGTVDPTDPAKLVVSTSHPAPYTRKVSVYVPSQYVAGAAAPFIVGADGPDPLLFTVLDNLIAQKRVPTMVAISIGNGSGDAQGSQRGLEYDTMSGRYAEFVETEVLPRVEQQCQVKLSREPDARATMGCSSGAAAAFIMAWYHPEWYHRVLSYSGTFVNQQWPSSADTPHGAWEFHDRLIPGSPAKPIRLWMHVGDRDLFNPNVMRDGMHDWVVANERMAAALAAKGYTYQFLFVKNAGHCDRAVKQQTLPQALEWLWKDYKGAVGEALPGRNGYDASVDDVKAVAEVCSRVADAIGRRDVATLATLLDPAFQARAPGGESHDRSSFLDAVRSIPGDIISVGLEQLAIDVTTDHALATGIQRARVRIDGREIEDRRAFADWLVRTPDGWVMRVAVDLPAPAAATEMSK